MDVLEKIKKSLKQKEKDEKLSSILININKNEVIINFHNNKEKKIRSFNFFNEEMKIEEIKEGFRKLKEEDEIKEKELNFFENFNYEKDKHYLITKEKGKLIMVEFDLTNKEINKYEIKDKEKILKENLKFEDIIRLY